MPIEIDPSSSFPKWLPKLPFDETQPGSIPDRIRKAREGVQLVADDFVAASRRAANDTNLSQEGKQNAIRQEAEKLLHRLDTVTSSEVAAAERRVGILEHELRDQGSREAHEQVVDALRHREIRAWYQDLDASQQLKAIKHALDDGEHELLIAILSAPRVLLPSLVPEKIRETIEAEVLKRTSPEKFQELEELRHAVQVARESKAIVESYIKSEAGLSASFDERVKEAADQKRAES